MASVKKFGEAVVITSGLKLEDIRKIAKYRPEALVLLSEGEEKEPVFCIAPCEKRAGGISKYGAEFGGCDANGFAQVTMAYAGPDGDEETVKAAIADSIGGAVNMLTRLEAGLPAVVRQIDAEIAAIMANIEVG